VTLNAQELLLPDLSTAVLVTVFVPNGKCDPDAGELTTETLVEQLSVAVGVVNVTTVDAVPIVPVTVIDAGQMIVGGSLSITITFCVHVLEFPHASVAVQTTKFVPWANVPGAPLVTVTAPPQSSETAGLPSATPLAKHWPTSVFVVTSAGQVIVGGAVSLTVMVCWHVLLLCAESVALYVRITVNRFAQVWFVITSLTKLTVAVPQLPPAVTEDGFGAGTADAHATVTGAGQVIEGD
jgi:hypothetical protein